MAPVVGLVGLGLIHRGFPTVGVAQISILSTTVLVNSLYGIFHITLFYAFLILWLKFQLGNCVEIGIPMLLLVIGLSQVSDLV
jgi:hypothetical protein